MFRYICALSMILWTSLAAHGDGNKPTPNPGPTPCNESCILTQTLVAPPTPSNSGLKATGMPTPSHSQFELKF